MTDSCLLLKCIKIEHYMLLQIVFFTVIYQMSHSFFTEKLLRVTIDHVNLLVIFYLFLLLDLQNIAEIRKALGIISLGLQIFVRILLH